MSIARGKILPITLEEYLKMVEKEYSDYTPRGVHIIVGWDERSSVVRTQPDPVGKLASETPESAEVVVNYRLYHVVSNIPDADKQYLYIIAEGLALIPRKKVQS